MIDGLCPKKSASRSIEGLPNATLGKADPADAPTVLELLNSVPQTFRSHLFFSADSGMVIKKFSLSTRSPRFFTLKKIRAFA